MPSQYPERLLTPTIASLLSLMLLLYPLSIFSQVAAMPSPDFDGSGVVDIADFLLFIDAYGSLKGQEKYEAKYDLDGNGEIGFSDFLIFVENFGKSVTPEDSLVCGRTPQVRDAIVAVAPVSTCDAVTEMHLAAIDFLELSNKGISELKVGDFSGLSSLRSLGLGGNNISDVSPLTDLAGSGLTHLFIGYNSLTDISALSSLTNLTTLWINANPITDLSGLSALTNLTALHIQSIPVSDLSVLASLTKLNTLFLGFANHSDISPLSGLSELRFLYIVWSALSDLSPLATLTDLRVLDLSNNQIEDLSPLVNLVRLESLNLRNNQIVDASHLFANSGLAAGDEIDLRDNPLGTPAIDLHILELKKRGVNVSFDEVLITAASEPQIYKDNVFVLPMPGVDLRTRSSFSYEKFIAVVNGFYDRFEDVFDFLFVVANLKTGVSDYGYYGALFPVSNEVRGTGLGVFFDEEGQWGSQGKLKSIIHLVEYDGISNGPMLHELIHQWAAYIVANGTGGHWGVSSGNGQLGGFASNDLVALGNGRYTAGKFASEGYADNTVPYSPIELYLAGFLPPDDVPDLLIAEDASWLLDEAGQPVLAANGDPIFTATSIRTYTIADIVADHGARIPNFADAQKDFRAAVIFLIDEEQAGTRARLDAVSDAASWFSRASEDKNNQTYNFYEATGGRATITLGGLSELKK